jgi:hypothetical protein
MAPLMLAQVRSNWVYESAIKMNDGYFYYLLPLREVVVNLPVRSV